MAESWDGRTERRRDPYPELDRRLLDIDDRISGIDKQVGLLMAHIASEEGHLERKHQEVVVKLAEISDAIFQGNGYAIRMDRLEQIEKWRGWHLRALWVALVGVVANVVYVLMTRAR